MVKSILPTEMTGVVFIGGRRGLGKTYLAAQADRPENVLFLDFESKGRAVHSQLSFGEYHAVNEEAAGKGAKGLYDRTMAIITGIPQDKFTVAVLDNISPFEMGMNREVSLTALKSSEEYGMEYGNVIKNRYGGRSGIVNYWISERLVTPLQAKGIRLVIATAHVKPAWLNSVQLPNKFNVKGADRWQELSILTLVLLPGDYPPVPSALVMKEQLGSIKFDEAKGDFVIGRRLPYRLPRATFGAIRDYLAHPANLDSPKEGESIRTEEVQPYTDEISREQLTIVTEMAAFARHQQEEEAEIEADLAVEQQTQAKSLTTDQLEQAREWQVIDHLSIKAISERLSLPIPTVSAALAS